MNGKQVTPRVLATAALIFAVAGLSSYTASAKTSDKVSTPVLRLNGIQPDSARPLTAMVVDDPEAIYEGARIVHNVTVDGVKGMRVHATFRVKYGLGVPSMMIAYFYYDDADNTPLKTDDASYRDKKGGVSCHVNFTPAYDPAVYKDLQLFMPYEALNMESGENYDLKFYLALYDKEGERFFGKSGWYKFKLTMP
ncbi:MAG: hypothetical protein QOG23_255 [Blastocatellia bacterium]|jgi:hypothetical protein|nr:hypothetical protein [Blastocatellia bacterium]